MPVAPHPRRDEAISALRGGNTAPEVSASMGIPLRTVQLWAQQIGASQGRGARGAGKRPSERVQRVIDRLRAGDQPAQIATDLGISASAVRQIATRFSVAGKKKSA